MASWIAPKTFVAADKLTFAELNAAVGPLGDIQWLKDALAAIGVTANTGNQTVDSAMVGCRVYGGDQQIPSGVWTDVVWTQQRFGRLGGADLSFLLSDYPSRVHLSTKTPFSSTTYRGLRGHYMAGATIAWEGNTTGSRGMRLAYYNGFNGPFLTAAKMKEATGGGVNMTMSISGFVGSTADDWALSASDDLVCQVYQDSGDDLSIHAVSGASPEMWIARVGSYS